MIAIVFKLEKALVEGRFFASLQGLFDRLLAIIFKNIIFRFTKIEVNKIVFMTYNNRYICNPKYIAEGIIRQQKEWKLVWIVSPGRNLDFRNLNFPNAIKLVQRDTFEALYEIATAKIWIDNAINFLWNPIPKKKSQYYIETWHGSMGIKRIEKNKERHWIKTAEKTGRMTNLLISNSTFETQVYRDTWWPNTEVFACGHPRNDCFFSQAEMKKARKVVSGYYDVSSETKFILYAPTFRDTGHIDFKDFDYKRLVDALGKKFGGSWIVLVRKHFHDASVKLNLSKFNCVRNATGYPDMQELLMACDAGITDYSSWAYDYLLTRRPLFIYATDLEEYNTERGLDYPLETTPFPIANDNSELITKIEGFDNEIYQKKIDMFLKEKGCVEDGHAAERIVKKIECVIEGKKS